MKNADPKVVVPIAIVVIVVCLFFVMRSLGVGQSNAAPPISTGMPASLSAGVPGGNVPGMSGAGGAPNMSGTALSTPGEGGKSDMVPMPGAPAGK